MYGSLARWFHLITAPEDYREEAAFALQQLRRWCKQARPQVLELGSGGGNNALHLKEQLQMTLTDLSEPMLRLSQSLNPGCEHLQGDMRRLRLNRSFDAIFIHDAIAYMTTPEDLRAAMETAFAHCRPGGVALWMPDDTLERFHREATHGGHDDDQGNGLRYLEWPGSLRPDGCSFHVDYTYLLRQAGQDPQTWHDRHLCGVFSRAHWLRALEEVGFLPLITQDGFDRDIFLAMRPSVSFAPIQAQDTERLLRWLDAQPWPFHGPPRGPRTLESVARRWLSQDVDSHWVLEEGQVVGAVRIFDLADPTALLDLRLAAQARGRGVGRQVLGWVTRRTFAAHPSLRRLEAYTRADNLAMRRLLTSCGWRLEALHEAAWDTHEGTWVDGAGYALLRQRWENGDLLPQDEPGAYPTG